MTSLEAALRQIHTDLTEAQVSFALVGGLAVSARAEPRFTRDADLAVVLASDAEAEALIHSLRARGYGIEAIVEQGAVGRLATVRLTRSSNLQAPVVDLLFASSGIEREVVGDASRILARAQAEVVRLDRRVQEASEALAAGDTAATPMNIAQVLVVAL